MIQPASVGNSQMMAYMHAWVCVCVCVCVCVYLKDIGL